MFRYRLEQAKSRLGNALRRIYPTSRREYRAGITGYGFRIFRKETCDGCHRPLGRPKREDPSVTFRRFCGRLCRHARHNKVRARDLAARKLRKIERIEQNGYRKMVDRQRRELRATERRRERRNRKTAA